MAERPGYWSASERRQIVFIGYRVLWHPYRRIITNIYELRCSDELNYRGFFGIAREMNEQVLVTSTDRLEEVLADRRLRWSNPH